MKSLIVFVGIIFVILILFAFGCGSQNDLIPEISHKIITIDKCEYIYVSRRPSGVEFSLTHKGNCSNSVHIYSKP